MQRNILDIKLGMGPHIEAEPAGVCYGHGVIKKYKNFIL
jgi:hypothetical protein